MKTACCIPIKVNPERASGKNLRVLYGKKLHYYIYEYVQKMNVFVALLKNVAVLEGMI